MNTITIRGKEYTAKPCPHLVLLKSYLIAEKMDEVQKEVDQPEKADEYGKLWLDYCECFLVEDVSDLAVTKIEEWERQELVGFFVSRAASTTKKPDDGKKTSGDS